ncbi:group II intron reverse transcriptase/maturase [Pseudonocardia bannensis]|uniref:Group II intron reverse transcriptase/maturase n=1 Tax=Pseudonocardia bannensis TaxID=630973 RepID=A0A848DGY1_9PSEU|nr:group II intron reverse transcriptase/maturase [Pseudonocardia bannensis]NMH91907.1 group II intron reverse transcriptase/maturase [Pseudonocardia bannensis]
MRAARDNVGRLRQRIFKAAQAGDHKRVRNLQKLMLRSHSNTLLGVERVTELNAGRATAGVDGEVALTDEARADLVARVPREAATWQPLPVKRMYIPKAGAGHKLRPLGIPVIFDRVLQARVKNALEPEWEARFEIRSYGFRPGRGCHDAIEAIFNTLHGRGARRLWILDADLTAAFDRIDHSQLLAALGSFPGRETTRQWLKAGVFEPGKGFAPTEEGTPQGGVISPVLLNVALHGLEQAAGVRYRTSTARSTWALATSPVLVRYADDFVVACHSQQQAEQVKARLAQWLAVRGLALNEDKTSITHADRGFDFLGFNIRRYPNGKLLIKPSTAAITRIRKRLREVFQKMRGATVLALIQTLNPIISGWAAYYRAAVSSGVFSLLDDYVWKLALKWATRRHRNKPKKWIADRYFGRFHPHRKDRWVLGDRDSGVYLLKFSWTRIVRHQLVTGGSSPDDPALADYWARRRRKHKPPLGRYAVFQLQRQHGRCPICGDYLLHADHAPTSTEEWEQWFRVTRKAISKHSLKIAGGAEPGTPDRDRLHLVHTRCRRSASPRGGIGPALLRA